MMGLNFGDSGAAYRNRTNLRGCKSWVTAHLFHLQLAHLVVKRHGIDGRFESEDSSHREMD